MEALVRRAHDAATRAGRVSTRPAAWAALLSAVLLVPTLSGCSRTPSATEAATVPVPEGHHVGAPAIAIDPTSGDVLLMWMGGADDEVRLWFARSRDEGASWSHPVAVTPPGEPLRIHAEASPRMVVDPGKGIGVAYATSVPVEGRRFPASDLRFARSLDGGVTWQTPVTVNDDTASGPGSHSFHNIVLWERGTLFASWLDSRPGREGIPSDSTEGNDASIHLSRSDDFGVTWNPNQGQWDRVCPCCKSDIGVDPFGHVYVSFRRHYEGQIRDAVIARPDGPPVRMYPDHWRIEGCPHSGPSLDLPLDGTIRMAWFTGAPDRAGVWFRSAMPETMDSTSTPVAVMRGTSLPTVHVSLATAGVRGSLIAMDSDSSGARRLTLARVESSGRRLAESFTVPGSDGAQYPHLAASPNRTTAYAVWTRTEGERGRLHLTRWRLGR